MTLPSSGSFEELNTVASPIEGENPLATGLPPLWWPSIWGLGSVVYSAFWMLESWKAAKPLLGPTKVNHLTQDLASLLVTLGCCYALYLFWKPRSETFGIILSLLVTAAAMTWHRF